MSSTAMPVVPWFSSRRNLRLTSGLVLFTYVTLHLSSHALGLVSLDAAEGVLRATNFVWHSGPGTVLLYGAAALHVGLALLVIYDRRTLRIAPLNGLRIVLGLVMPLALIGHFVGTRYAFEHFGLAADYSRVAASLWKSGAQGLTLGLLAPGWVHGCLGLRFAFSHRRLWQRLRLELFGAALLLPVLAGLGFVTMGRELSMRPAVVEQRAGPTDAQRSELEHTRETALQIYIALIALVVVGRTVRSFDERRRKALVIITYPGQTVSVPRGWTVLEASRSFGIPHQSMCGGRGRCSTCRVRVIGGQDHCPPPGPEERHTLDRIGAPGAVRLACQLRPTGDIAVEPILRAERSAWSAAPAQRPPREGRVALLFFDVRLGCGTTASNASPHDTIYALSQFQVILDCVAEPAGGAICSRRADHWVALFGLDSDLQEGCRQAMATARRIDQQATALSLRLADELGLHTDFTIGVHAGPVVVGMIGRGEERTLSALGEAVDAVARLQQFAATRAARFVISRQAAAASGIDEASLEWQPLDAERGPLLLCAVPAMIPAVS